MPLQIVRQDITKMQVDAIVNTTNREMIGYSGVDLSVHTAAGKGLDEECRALAPLEEGEVRVTGAYALPCKYIIHTIGPVWRGGLHGEVSSLRECYRRALELAARQGCESVAFPLISSGEQGFPKDRVLSLAVTALTALVLRYEICVYICVYDKESYSLSKRLFDGIRSFIDESEVRKDISQSRRMYSRSVEFNSMYDEVSYARLCRAPEPENTDREPLLTLEEYIKQMDKSFQEKLFELIDKSGMTDVECYKRANVDKRTFSKIKSNKDYRPSKQTAIAFAIALRLDLGEAQALLETVGYTLSNSSVFDKIIRYFIHIKNYNIFEINEALFAFDQNLLGSV